MSKSKSRVFAIGALTGFVVGVGVTAAYFTPLFDYPGGSSKRMDVLSGCKNLAAAIDAFVNNPSSADAGFPKDLSELVNPPFGGPSFMRNGKADLIDPWASRTR